MCSSPIFLYLGCVQLYYCNITIYSLSTLCSCYIAVMVTIEYYAFIMNNGYIDQYVQNALIICLSTNIELTCKVLTASV